MRQNITAEVVFFPGTLLNIYQTVWNKTPSECEIYVYRVRAPGLIRLDPYVVYLTKRPKCRPEGCNPDD
jgi:hypothetical protein